jgi:hypothetical protein
MSVYSGRQQRELIDVEKALYHFQKTEGQAKLAEKQLPNTLLALLLIAIAGSLTTVAVFNSNDEFTILGFVSLLIIGIIFTCVSGLRKFLFFAF